MTRETVWRMVTSIVNGLVASGGTAIMWKWYGPRGAVIFLAYLIVAHSGNKSND